MCYVYVNVCMCMCMFFPVGFCFRARDAAEYSLEYWYIYANYLLKFAALCGQTVDWYVACTGLVCCMLWTRASVLYRLVCCILLTGVSYYMGLVLWTSCMYWTGVLYMYILD